MSARGRAKAKEGAPSTGTRSVSPARLAAFRLLRRVEEDGAYAAPLLAALGPELRPEDRALCHELVLGVLRRQLWLDALIGHYAGRAADGLDAPVRRALRLGLYQLRFLSRTPASAVVNESVNLAYLSRLRSAAGFINAVLRRAAREPEFDPAEGIEDPVERLAVESSHPAWLVGRWVEAFGADEAESFARSNNEAPPVAFRVVSARADESEVIKALQVAGATVLPSLIAPDAWRVEGGSGELLKLAREGKVYIQDEASQLVAHALGARAGDRVLDVCAAPGSKATLVAALAGGKALVVAGDLHEHRARTVLEAAERQGAEGLSVVVHDAERALPYPEGYFDHVLVDAPCTGTGTLRRNPEIRWRITDADVRDLSSRQRRILSAAARMVRPGGRLVYSTCSVEPEEDEEVASAFLKENGDFAPGELDVPGPLKTYGWSARTWPHRDGADGFFLASFERGA